MDTITTIHFPQPPLPPPPRSLKRPRPLSDPDPHHLFSKKRRLRLTVITSRLSSPFAIPPTNIPERPWRFGRRRGREGVMRKVAILNRIRREEVERQREKEKDRERRRAVFRERLKIAVEFTVERGGCVVVGGGGAARRRAGEGFEMQRGRRAVEAVDSAEMGKVAKQQQREGAGRGFEIPRSRRPPSPPDEEVLEEVRRGIGIY